jgi:hypothetical protein
VALAVAAWLGGVLFFCVAVDLQQYRWSTERRNDWRIRELNQLTGGPGSP